MKDFQSGLFLNKIPYVTSGSGPNPIVVLNGGQAFVRRPTPARAMRDASRIARLLPRGRPIYILGYDPSPAADYTVGTIVDDVARILGDIGPATVMGISFGGFVAARLAADRPDLVTELILTVSAHRFSPEGRRSVDRQIACAWAGDFDGFLDEFGLVFRRPWLNWLIRLRFRQERKRLLETMNDPVTIVRGLNAVAGEEFGRDPSWLARIAAPALVVGATRDPFFDVAALEETARLIPGAQLRLFKNETHMLPVERARDVAAVIAQFLRKHRGTASGGSP
ncbi:alpha/beta fold hydrolase [Microvirga lotononidis]|uniref:Putative hydrolase or acyltransferase of alpha/beta superfamily n=1 Tax=Microvirga lotononidis TaxID=864069 RepID=I4YNT6_9HYPH|nr:alpha/beta hydrolase [Microvirga lotononidis]EIM25628.1 putative hydrolase or acyltransferase of alpha/beta superfamily [Microvirga lotononidis]WQO26487.1 alpha/beta hydrolase [Microvirga lotononidis]